MHLLLCLYGRAPGEDVSDADTTQKPLDPTVPSFKPKSLSASVAIDKPSVPVLDPTVSVFKPLSKVQAKAMDPLVPEFKPKNSNVKTQAMDPLVPEFKPKNSILHVVDQSKRLDPALSAFIPKTSIKASQNKVPLTPMIEQVLFLRKRLLCMAGQNSIDGSSRRIFTQGKTTR